MPDAGFLRRAVRDPALLRIAERVLDGDRLSFADGLTLSRSGDLTGVGRLANFVRERMHGDRTYYVRNRHINYTNVCNKHCKFCYFARSPRDGGPKPYTLSPDDVREALARCDDPDVAEIHIVGGIDPRLPYSYYLELIRAVRSARPRACIKAFTVVELVQIQNCSGRSMEHVLRELKEAGLSAVPGGGAEVLSDRVHAELHPLKLRPAEWLKTSRLVAAAGIPQYATMLYGHVETDEERVAHLIRLRELQDDTGHFLAFTPLSFHPEGTYLASLPRPTGCDDLRMVALSRLMLDNVPHVKTFWVMSSPAVSQIALHYGADDLDGTVQEYRITYEDGRLGDPRQHLASSEMVRLIEDAGREPVERDGLYRAPAA